MENAVVVEDEKAVLESFLDLLDSYCPEIKVVGTARNVEEAIALVKNKKPHIVFLDVELPDGTGFDVLRNIPVENVKVIFVTAYSDYALKAIKYSAIDYLLKPIIPDELIDAVNKAQKFIKYDAKNTENYGGQSQVNEDKAKRIVVKTKNDSYYLKIDEISYLKADGNYTELHLIDKKTILASKTLKFFSEILEDDGFLRVHQSYLVNPKFIKELKKSTIELLSGEELEVSRRKRASLLDYLRK